MIDVPEGATPTEQLQHLLRFWDQMRHELGVTGPPEGWRYQSTEGLVVDKGTVYTPRPLPAGERPMTIKQCFVNSYIQAAMLHEDLTYVEGYGMTGLGLPNYHAWCLDANGEVLDFTWRWTSDGGDKHLDCAKGALIGVPVPTRLLKAVWRSREYVGVLQDYEHDFPVLRLGWDTDALTEFYEGLPGPEARKRQKRAKRKRKSAVVP